MEEERKEDRHVELIELPTFDLRHGRWAELVSGVTDYARRQLGTARGCGAVPLGFLRAEVTNLEHVLQHRGAHLPHRPQPG